MGGPSVIALSVDRRSSQEYYLPTRQRGVEMKVKFFSRTGNRGSYKTNQHQELEDEVNAWLEQNRDVKIIDIKQSASGGSWTRPQFFVTIIYEHSS